MDAEYTVTNKTRFDCPRNIVQKELICSMLMACKIAHVEANRLKTDFRSVNSGMNTIDRHEVLRGPSVGTIQFLLQYCVNFTALSPLK
jgi:hypothetical protein